MNASCMDSPCRVLVVAKDSLARLAYEQALTGLGLDALFVTCPSDVFGALETDPVCGIMLDIADLIRDKCHDKAAIAQVGEFYPVARVRWDARLGRVMAISETSLDPDQALAEFAKACLLHGPRTLRVNRRHNLALHGHIRLATPDQSGPEIRTWTANFSLLGCFVCLQNPEQFSPGVKVELQLPSLGELPPLQATVVWVSAFGQDGANPGLGLRFGTLIKPLRQAVAGVCGLKP